MIASVAYLEFKYTTDSCHSHVRALIHSRIDYCNGLMSGVSLQLLDQLDGVMRAAAHTSAPEDVLHHICHTTATALVGHRLPHQIQTLRACPARPQCICLGTSCLFHPLLDGLISGLRRRQWRIQGATGGHGPPKRWSNFFSHLVIQITDRFFE